jgi:hypothetical protein
VVLRRRGLAPRILAPVSLALATWSRAYVEGLTTTRYRGRADSAGAHEGINRWVALFSAACGRAVDDAAAFEATLDRIHEHWGATLGRTRAGSAAERLLATLPGAPVVSVSSAANLIGRSFQATNEAMKRLEAAGIVRQGNVGRRNRAFEAPAVIDAFTALERRLASSAGETRSAPPNRPTPARPR